MARKKARPSTKRGTPRSPRGLRGRRGLPARDVDPARERPGGQVDPPLVQQPGRPFPAHHLGRAVHGTARGVGPHDVLGGFDEFDRADPPAGSGVAGRAEHGDGGADLVGGQGVQRMRHRPSVARPRRRGSCGYFDPAGISHL